LNENQAETIRVLVVSREAAVLRLLWALEESSAWELETAATGWDARERVEAGGAPQLVMVDLARGDAEGLHLLRWLRRVCPDVAVLVLCHADDGARGKEAIGLGAKEILVRPLDKAGVEGAIRRHLGMARANGTAGAGNSEAEIIETGINEAEIIGENVEQLGEDTFFVSASLIMQKLRAQATLLAKTDVPVLILGEAGTGKYTVASLIHKLSVRSGFKLQRVNCAEMPEALLEAELFGEEKAPANGRRTSLGKFGAGEKGTIVLEEIAAMPAGLQSRLLQVLQNQVPNHEFRRPGGVEGAAADVRILAASSANLERVLAGKQLREDLYYRLSAFTVHVPPLRQRKDEIAILLRYFMHKLAKHYSLPSRGFSPSVLDACQRYSWPGNLRELERFVKRYLIAGDQIAGNQLVGNLELALGEMGIDPAETSGRTMLTQTVRLTASGRIEREAGEKPRQPESLKSLIQGIKSEAEQNAIGAALKRTGWNRKAAARLLRVSYRTLLYKIDQYHMRAPEPYLSPLPVEEFSVFGNEGKDNGKAS
jgi:two-component system response regulator AtoC